MIRFFTRAIGLIFLAVAFVFLVYDGTKSIAGNAIFYTSLTETWNSVSATSLAQLEPLVERYAGSWGWDQFSRWILSSPTFVIFGVIGSLLVLIGRKPEPLIGYDR
ncbi:MAG: hypothetical protein JO134_19040 [Xanthobacteraceae bacterium]|nr:hypothetical protein [Xanthobacteraceae bacterium]